MRVGLCLFIFAMLWLVSAFVRTPCWAEDCELAKQLFERSVKTSEVSVQKELLRQAVENCPSCARAHNNLGLIYEQEGNLDLAVQSYRQAMSISPDFPHPCAGLGDVYLKQEKYEEAARMYSSFLNIASKPDTGKNYPDIGKYLSYVEQQLRKTEQHLGRPAGMDAAQGSMTVSSEEIIAKLTNEPGKRARGSFDHPKIAITIQFETGSALISNSSLPQMKEVGEALAASQLKGHKISIEGHTDDVGDEAYNRDLSRRRAAEVKDYLMIYFGIASQLLQVKGHGECCPIASNDTSWGRAQNRRVEFVNLGPYATAEGGHEATEIVAQPLPDQQATGGVTTTPNVSPQPMPAREKLKIAILELDYLNKSGASDPLGKMISEFLTTAAVNTGAFSIAEREQLAKVLKELELNQTGMVSEGDAREIGRMVGAKAILTGSVSRIGNAMRIDARFIDVESGNIMAAAEQIISNASDMESISDGARGIMHTLVAKLP